VEVCRRSAHAGEFFDRTHWVCDSYVLATSLEHLGLIAGAGCVLNASAFARGGVFFLKIFPPGPGVARPSCPASANLNAVVYSLDHATCRPEMLSLGLRTNAPIKDHYLPH
jgi:hypothetical protein